jgi:SAM-dependent methyltransferase
MVFRQQRRLTLKRDTSGVGISTARDLMVTEFEWAAASEPMADVEAHMRETQLGTMLVRSERGRLEMVVTGRMLADLRAGGTELGGLSAGDVARPITPVAAADSLDAAFDALQAQLVARLPVVEGEREVGVIRRGDIFVFRDIEERLGDGAGRLIADVSPHDEMFHGGVSAYLANGVLAVEGVRRAQAVAGKRTFESILDFACGHGRVLRTLKAEFPDAELAACDLNEDGVRFCARTFGARPFLSHVDPDRIELTGDFDLVWCASLLTHLDADRWSAFLDLFTSVLRPSGLLLFTVLGPRAAPAVRSRTLFGAPSQDDRVRRIVEGYDADGFGYADYAGHSGYGLSLCTPRWVARKLEAQDGLELLNHDEGALEVQDIVAACRR